ncbi:MAG: type I restriction enzyme HsdR N-terminal domain-containing protein [Bacteroidetes bacterium]|nr:type I restriction enzyme HsdR N-terminal domain-containing protein [Bacteroidota bacterium]MBS1541615.1 type I restriction enzyme HsdR N-terminal domain-containing protein [Bacteroidota bacterium]
MYKLNLPAYEVSLKKENGKVWIFDGIRKKFLVLTPEEWVRQHFIQYLITEMKYPKSLFRIEGSLLYNRLQKRSDILVFNRSGKPWMLVECKSPTIKLNQKAFNQVAVYNMTLGAKYLAVTNGMAHFCFEAAIPGHEPKTLEHFPQFE